MQKPVTTSLIIALCLLVPLLFPFTSTVAKTYNSKENTYYAFGITLHLIVYLVAIFVIRNVAKSEHVPWVVERFWIPALLMCALAIAMLTFLLKTFPTSKCKVPPETIMIKFSLIQMFLNLIIVGVSFKASRDNREKRITL